MGPKRNFRVSVVLSDFFRAETRRARIWIDDDIKKISDLAHRIEEIFQIKNFQLVGSQDHYLPPSEDVEILDDKELIWVFQNEDQYDKSASTLDIGAEETRKKRPISPTKKSQEESQKKKKKRLDITEQVDTELPSTSSTTQSRQKESTSNVGGEKFDESQPFIGNDEELTRIVKNVEKRMIYYLDYIDKITRGELWESIRRPEVEAQPLEEEMSQSAEERTGESLNVATETSEAASYGMRTSEVHDGAAAEEHTSESLNVTTEASEAASHGMGTSEVHDGAAAEECTGESLNVTTEASEAASHGMGTSEVHDGAAAEERTGESLNVMTEASEAASHGMGTSELSDGAAAEERTGESLNVTTEASEAASHGMGTSELSDGAAAEERTGESLNITTDTSEAASYSMETSEVHTGAAAEERTGESLNVTTEASEAASHGMGTSEVHDGAAAEECTGESLNVTTEASQAASHGMGTSEVRDGAAAEECTGESLNVGTEASEVASHGMGTSEATFGETIDVPRDISIEHNTGLISETSIGSFPSLRNESSELEDDASDLNKPIDETIKPSDNSMLNLNRGDESSSSKMSAISSKKSTISNAARASGVGFLIEHLRGNSSLGSLDLLSIDYSEPRKKNRERRKKKNGSDGRAYTRTGSEKSFIGNIFIYQRKPRLISEEDILKIPLMEESRLPKEGDVIGFKALLIVENYTPGLSSRIIGTVLQYCKESKEVLFTILSGLGQCNKAKLIQWPGSEKFKAKPKRRVMAWKDVMDARLLTL